MRTGLVSTSALALALLAGSPVLADDTPAVGSGCTAATVLPANLICDTTGHVADAPAATPTDVPTATPAPTDSPLPTESATPSPSGSASPTPTPSTSESGSTTTSTDSTKTGSAATAAKDTANAPKTLLAAATLANASVGTIPTLGSVPSVSTLPPLVAGSPLSAYTPSPVLANLPPVTSALNSVQAPLLAAGDDAAAGGGFSLAGLSSRALPGLLVVLATALVAAVGAGNLRYWQDKFGARR